MPPPNKTLIGKIGEMLAETYLTGRGCRVVERNYRCAFGEIDLIVRDRGVLAFVEVRTKASEAFGHPLESVDWVKQRKVRVVAGHYLSERGSGFCEGFRFDVVGILFKEGEDPSIQWVAGAFAGA